MKRLIHGYRKGECNPKIGQQLTLCGREIHQMNRYFIHILGEQHYGREKITCSNCLARLDAQKPQLQLTVNQ
jgi:hypothetical protein